MDCKLELCKFGLELFGIEKEILSISPFFEYFNLDSKPSEVKVILKVVFENSQTLVLRITKEKHIDNHLAEIQYQFSQELMNKGIRTPKRYQVEGKYVLERNFLGHEMNFALEDYSGDCMKILNVPLIKDIGSLLGKMHKVSEQNNIRLNTKGYVFNLLGDNEVVGFYKLKELLKEYSQFADTIIEIENKYSLILKEISKKIKTVQKYAVQGDINASNLSLIDGELRVYDYNIACDEYLIVQATLEGLCLSYEEKFDDNSTVLFTFDVEIIDNRTFTIELLGEESITIEVDSIYEEPGVTTTCSDGSTPLYDVEGLVDTSVLGEQTLTYTLTGKEISVSRTVTVVDATPPTISFVNLDSTYMSLSGILTNPEFLIEDNYEAVENITLHEERHGDFSVAGDYTIDYWVEDSNGNLSSKIILNVHVLDVTLPHVVLDGEVEVTLEYGETYVEEGAFIIKADGTTEILTSDIVAPTTIGTHTLTYAYTDTADVTHSIVRTLHIVDTTKPVLTLNGDSEITIEVYGDYTELSSIVTDNHDVTLTAEIEDTTLDLNTLGDYVISYNITDSNGNIAETVTRTIHVVDTTSPIITLNGDDHYILSVGDSFEDLSVLITDNYNSLEELELVISGEADTSIDGIYVITYQVTDASGNESEIVTRTIEVSDYFKEFTLELLLDGTYEITEYIGSDTNVYIPESIAGVLLTSIGERAFQNKGIQSVEIPSTVTTIGDYAFGYNYDLTEITIPDGVTHIGVLVLSSTAITQLNLPSSLATIGLEAFGHMYECTDIFVDEDNVNFSSVDGVLFNEDETVLITHPIGRTDSVYEVPFGTITIFQNAFGASRNIEEVILPTTLTTIEREAFISSVNLQYILLPDSVTTIGGRAFANAENLTIFAEVTSKPVGWESNWNSHDQGGEVPVVWGYVPTDVGYFEYTETTSGVTITGYSESGPLDVVIPNYINGKPVVTIGDEAFKRLELTSIILPHFLEKIGDRGLSSNKLTEIVLPESLIRIGNFAFASNLISGELHIGANLNVIDDYAFADFYETGFSFITVDEGNTTFASLDGVLFNKTLTKLILYPSDNNRTEYTIPNSVVEIGKYAFQNATLTNLILPDGLISIEQNAFYWASIPVVDLPLGIAELNERFNMYTLIGEFQINGLSNTSNGTFRVVDGVLFNDASTTLLAYPAASNEISYRYLRV